MEGQTGEKTLRPPHRTLSSILLIDLKILQLFFCLSFYGDKVYLPTCIHVHFKIRLIHISVTKEMKGLKPYEKWLHIAGGYLKSYEGLDKNISNTVWQNFEDGNCIGPFEPKLCSFRQCPLGAAIGWGGQFYADPKKLISSCHIFSWSRLLLLKNSWFPHSVVLLLDYNILISLFNHMTEGIKKACFIWTSLHKCCILSAISNYFKLRKE